MRRSTALAAAALFCASAAGIAPAHAQTTTFELLTLINGNVKTADCGLVGTILRGTGHATDTTTRSELVTNLNKAVGSDVQIRLATGATIGAIADRAVECGVVKEDPTTPVDQAIRFASQLSSQANLPQVRDLLPALTVR
ncbi:Alpha helical Porin B [Corynebacterium capitovis DSM 44611]|uniref:hypothetical protein n=1 Tax=Corynebacterium capitovis TaxID=131081 RepID=UPI000382A9CD|nr:hypothetical protein [Corynebacterium capitovis]WKD57268.1 Alpha helical Porin B [Corynebacterium capitovis DSM 44611]